MDLFDIETAIQELEDKIKEEIRLRTMRIPRQSTHREYFQEYMQRFADRRCTSA